MGTTQTLLIHTMVALFVPIIASAEVNAPANRVMCINGPMEKNKEFIVSVDVNKDPLHLEFLKSQQPKKAAPPARVAGEVAAETAPTVMTDIESCFPTDASKKNYSWFAQLRDYINSVTDTHTESSMMPETAKKEITELAKHAPPTQTSPKIKRECIAASMTRSPGNDGYTCGYPTAKEAKRGFSAKTQSVPKPYGKAGGETLQCLNDRMVDYMTFAVNSALECMSGDEPIDSRVIYKKLNNETGFTPSLASIGGMGIGQTTSPAKNELTDRKLGKGRYILENIVNSKKPECNGFKGVAAADLKRSPSVKNTCDWVNPGDGLARSLMYTIGYYLTMRDQYVIPTLEKRSVKLIENKSLVSDFTAIAYGAEGLDHAKWLMQKYRVGRGTNAKTLQNNIRKDSVYLSNIKDKMQEISCIRQGKAADKACKQQPISEADAEADSCITK
ncbi:MAG: hypothetical protein JSU04_08335 [Bdellovibrionales bacterium]|nr:hypothetical protein [Bdellovibrionales bacterium]